MSTTELEFSIDALRTFMSDLTRLEVAMTLHLTDGCSERVFYFVKGGVRVFSSGPRSGPRLPDYLLESQRIDVHTLHEVLEASRTERAHLRQILHDREILTSSEFDEVLAHLVREGLFELVY